MNGAAVWLRLRLQYWYPDGGPLTEGLEVTDSPIVVYPEDRVFSDATTGSQLAYQGRPYSAITLEASNPPDQRPDLFVTIAEAVDPYPDKSVLYRQHHLSRPIAEFSGDAGRVRAGRSASARLPGRLRRAAGCRAVGRTVRHASGPGQTEALHLRPRSRRTDKYANVADLEQGAWFSAAAVTDSLYPSTCAAGRDIDRDGDLDLHVGRGDIDDGTAVDVLFENQGPGAPTRFARRPDVQFPPASGRSLVWFDRDSDWQWDVLLGGAGGGETTQLHWFQQDGFIWSFELAQSDGSRIECALAVDRRRRQRWRSGRSPGGQQWYRRRPD